VVSESSLHTLVLVWRCGAAQMQIRSRPCSSKPIFKSSQPISVHSASSFPFQSGVSRRAYLMVLSVFRRIHWGMGLFCFWALASFCLVRNDLWDCRNVSTACYGMLQSLSIADSSVRTGILTVLSGCLCGCSVGSRLGRYRGTPAAKFAKSRCVKAGGVSALPRSGQSHVPESDDHQPLGINVISNNNDVNTVH
jgi:hypothetical protein